MPKRIKEYCKKTGQKVPETKGEVVRCIAESLAFKYRQTVEGMEDVTGNKYNVVNIVGGGIKDKMICQFTANATKRVVSTGHLPAIRTPHHSFPPLLSNEHRLPLQDVRDKETPPM